MAGAYGRVVEFFKDEDGLTVVEYIVSAGLLVVVLSGLFTVLYGAISDRFESMFSD
ncbi:hypothetical protein KP803_04125 [Vibrio sp. ZSDE26]|uniref:Flp family type IVb pilin n=1 Tax=Vibrio amylolyticus TaxID=2847292 RepID=A0A9X1XGA9_9VIBR|nr:hypothetical protein [Vibrio amylolyticus]MCK6262454.1 hypothetical protein [Vibrio amylolyticus]